MYLRRKMCGFTWLTKRHLLSQPRLQILKINSKDLCQRGSTKCGSFVANKINMPAKYAMMMCWRRRTCWRWLPSRAFLLALCWPCGNLPRRADRPSGPTSRCRTLSLPVTSFKTITIVHWWAILAMRWDFAGDRPGAPTAGTVSVGWRHQLCCFLRREWSYGKLIIPLVWILVMLWRYLSH